MGYRLYIAPPTREHYSSIFQKVVRDHELNYDPQLLEFVFQRYDEDNRPLKCCDPRDLIHHVLDICRYVGQAPELTRDLLELAWMNYFGRDNSR